MPCPSASPSWASFSGRAIVAHQELRFIGVTHWGPGLDERDTTRTGGVGHPPFVAANLVHLKGGPEKGSLEGAPGRRLELCDLFRTPQAPPP